MKPYYKENLGSYCRNSKCKKRKILGDDIGYVVYGATYCKDHAKDECEKHSIEFPALEKILGDPRFDNYKKRKDILDFLTKYLRLEVRESGGCPEENYPADRDIYLVLAGRVISEIRLD